MAEQLAPVAPELPLAPPRDPWQDVRAIAPGAILMRVIAANVGLQFWIRFERTPKNIERGAEVYDGSTVVLPSPPGGRPHGEIDRLTAEANALWPGLDSE